MHRIWLIHSFWAGLMLFTLLRSGEHPASLFFAFLLSYLYRILALGGVFLAAAGRGKPPAWAGLFIRRPGPLDRNEPVREGSSTGPPARISAYLLVILVMGLFGFILAHTVNTKDFDVTLPQALAELKAASWLALIWFLQDLTGKVIVADFGKSLTHNLGYNSKETSILAVTVLTGGFLLVVGEAFGMKRTPWWIVGSLLFYRWLWGTWEDEQRLKAEEVAKNALRGTVPFPRKGAGGPRTG